MIELSKSECQLGSFNNCPGDSFNKSEDVKLCYVDVEAFDETDRAIEFIEKPIEPGPTDYETEESSWQNSDDTVVVLLDFDKMSQSAIADVVFHFCNYKPDEIQYYECEQGVLFRLWWD